MLVIKDVVVQFVFDFGHVKFGIWLNAVRVFSTRREYDYAASNQGGDLVGDFFVGLLEATVFFLGVTSGFDRGFDGTIIESSEDVS